MSKPQDIAGVIGFGLEYKLQLACFVKLQPKGWTLNFSAGAWVVHSFDYFQFPLLQRLTLSINCHQIEAD